MKRTIITILALMLMAGCGGSQPSADSSSSSAGEAEAGLLRAAVLYDITTMDVAKTTDDYLIPMNIFERLFETRPDGQSSVVENSLCTDYAVREDGLSYAFAIADNAVFSNGNALSASDVQYSFERLLKQAQQNTDIPLEIAGGEAVMNGEAEHLSGFEIQDDTHFTITLNTPNAGFIAELSSPCMSIVDEETAGDASFGQDPAKTIGSGPYMVTEWAANDHYTLEYNPRWRGDTPSVTKVIVKVIPDPGTQNLMFQNGELDLIDLNSLDSAVVESAYRNTWKDHIVTRPKVGLFFFGMNENNRYLSDVRVRQAIGAAINVQELIDGIYSGDALPETGIIPSGIEGHNDAMEGFRYDPEAAKRMLAEAGYKDGEISFELSLDSGMNSGLQLIYQAIAQQLAAVGIKAEIKTYDHTSWLDLRTSGKMDSYVGRWLMDYNDPANIMVTFFGGKGKTDIRSLNYPDTEIMDRVAKASTIVDDAARVAEYQALEAKIIAEDAAWIPLLSELHLYCTGKRVRSFTPQWAGFGDFYVTDVVLN